MLRRIALVACLIAVVSGCGNSRDPSSEVASQSNDKIHSSRQASPVGAIASAAQSVSALAMVENWGIVADERPFYSRPGAAFPQEVFNFRAQESIKWLEAIGKLEASYRANGMQALAGLSQPDFDKNTLLQSNVIPAFVSELSMDEHIQLAKAEASRPQSFYNARVREAFEWVVNLQSLSTKDRLDRWEAALAKSSADLRAEFRRRYNEQCPADHPVGDRKGGDQPAGQSKREEVSRPPTDGTPPNDALTCRTWTSKDGRKVEAAFLRAVDGAVWIRKKSDGKTFSIPLAQLSDEDQRWVQGGSAHKPDSEPVTVAAPQGWPKYTDSLAGMNEVRVTNPNALQVRVGLRSSGKGRDFVVSANDNASVNVPDGKYEIYFVYSSEPEGVYQGDSFTLSNNGVEIQIVKVADGNYGIRKVK